LRSLQFNNPLHNILAVTWHNMDHFSLELLLAQPCRIFIFDCAVHMKMILAILKGKASVKRGDLLLLAEFINKLGILRGDVA